MNHDKDGSHALHVSAIGRETERRLFLMHSHGAQGAVLQRLIARQWHCCSSDSVEEALLHLHFHDHAVIVCQLPLEDESVLGFLRTIDSDTKLRGTPRVCILVDSKTMRVPQKEMTFAAKLFGVSHCVRFPKSVADYGELMSVLHEHSPATRQ